MVRYRDFENRSAWLRGRNVALGASDIPVVCGLVSYKTPLTLWKEKTGTLIPPDLRSDSRISYGTEAEDALRTLFRLKHRGEYEMEYHPFRIYSDENTPFLAATLDGELTRISDNQKGIWECKTVLVDSQKTLEDWTGRIPDKYYAQVCGQFASTDCSFAILNAELRFPDHSSEIREYFIDRKECENDISYVVSECEQFWHYVRERKRPPAVISL